MKKLTAYLLVISLLFSCSNHDRDNRFDASGEYYNPNPTTRELDVMSSSYNSSSKGSLDFLLGGGIDLLIFGGIVVLTLTGMMEIVDLFLPSSNDDGGLNKTSFDFPDLPSIPDIPDLPEIPIEITPPDLGGWLSDGKDFVKSKGSFINDAGESISVELDEAGSVVDDTGSVLGTAVDSTGAVLKGSEYTIVSFLNTETGKSHMAVLDSSDKIVGAVVDGSGEVITSTIESIANPVPNPEPIVINSKLLFDNPLEDLDIDIDFPEISKPDFDISLPNVPNFDFDKFKGYSNLDGLTKVDFNSFLVDIGGLTDSLLFQALVDIDFNDFHRLNNALNSVLKATTKTVAGGLKVKLSDFIDKQELNQDSLLTYLLEERNPEVEAVLGSDTFAEEFNGYLDKQFEEHKVENYWGAFNSCYQLTYGIASKIPAWLGGKEFKEYTTTYEEFKTNLKQDLKTEFLTTWNQNLTEARYKQLSSLSDEEKEVFKKYKEDFAQE